MHTGVASAAVQQSITQPVSGSDVGVAIAIGANTVSSLHPPGRMLLPLQWNSSAQFFAASFGCRLTRRRDAGICMHAQGDRYENIKSALKLLPQHGIEVRFSNWHSGVRLYLPLRGSQSHKRSYLHVSCRSAAPPPNSISGPSRTVGGGVAGGAAGTAVRECSNLRDGPTSVPQYGYRCEDSFATLPAAVGAQGRRGGGPLPPCPQEAERSSGPGESSRPGTPELSYCGSGIQLRMTVRHLSAHV